VADETRDRLAEEYRDHLAELRSIMDDSTLSVVDDTFAVDEERILRRAVIPAKRSALIALRDAGRIDDVVFRHIQARLDAEELRLSGVLEADD
jgi:hypothetical protein